MFSPKTAHTAKDNNTPSVFKPKNGSDLFVQPKVKVGQPGDKYEVEADQVADQVVNKQQPGAASTITTTPASVQTMSEDERIQEKPIAERIQPLTHLSGTSPLQRMEEEESVQLQEEEEVQTMPEEDVQMQEEEEVQMMSEEEDIQMQEEGEEVQLQEDEDVQMQEEEDEVQARENPGNTGLNTTANISRTIRNTRGQGSPLPGGVQTQMESGFGADFSGVRIHTGSESVAMNQTLGAQAFTNGNDIHFNQNRFNPATTEGQTLLAHELTHTIQQGASGPATQNESTTTNNGGGSQVPSEATEEPSTTPVAEATELTEAPPLEGEVSVEQGTQEAGVAGEEVQPTTPRSPEEDPNFQKLEQRVENRAEDQQEHEPATASAGSAQAAAVSPPNERTGGAQAAQVDSMEEQEAGTFSAEAFKAQLMQRIESMQLPANEEEAADFENNNNIDEVREAATQDVQSEQAAAAGDIAATTAQEPNTDAIPERQRLQSLPPAPIGGSS